MLVIALALLIAAAAATPAVAHPPKPINKKGKKLRGPWHRYLHQAKVPVVKGPLKVILDGCPGRPKLGGCVRTRQPYRIYLRRYLYDRRGAFYHEIGHLFDLRILRRRHRKAFRRIFGLGGGRWFSGRLPHAELFAEAYSYCARFRRGRIGRASHTRYGYRASAVQHQAVCKLIRRAGAKPPRRPGPVPAPPLIVDHASSMPAAPAVPRVPAPAPEAKSGLGKLLDALF